MSGHVHSWKSLCTPLIRSIRVKLSVYAYVCLSPTPLLALIITVAEPLCCFAHLIRTEQQNFWHSLYPLGPIHFTLTCPPQSPFLMSKTSTEAPPSARIRTAVSQAIQTASSISQRELSRRRTWECKCDSLTGHDWQVKPLVNCLLLLTLMWNPLDCNVVGGVKQL